VNEKACARCGIAKPLDAFHRNRSKRLGRETECRECRHARRIGGKTTKVCSACHKSKPFELFQKNKQKRDGYDNRCKACRKIRDQARAKEPAEWRKALVRRQVLFKVTPVRASKPQPPVDVRRWYRVADPTQREAARLRYEKILAPPPCGGNICICGRCLAE
jgi:hypothetical protein